MNKKIENKRALSLFKTIGSTIIRAGKEKILKLNTSEEVNHSQAAMRLAKGLDELKGAAMKIGQMLSFSDDAMLPKGWKEALSYLQSNATPKPWEEMFDIIKDSLQDKYDEIEEINKIAVHAASIAQVYKAKLKTGEYVAIKVKYPQLENHISADINNMRSLLKIFNFLGNSNHNDQIIHSLNDLFLQEMDFYQELNFYKIYYKKFEFSNDFIVPKTIEHLSNKNILTLEWREGINILTWKKQNQHLSTYENNKNRLANNLLSLFFIELFDMLHIQSDPNPGNYLISPEGKIILLDFGATKQFNFDFINTLANIIVSLFDNNIEITIQLCKDIGIINHNDKEETVQSVLNLLKMTTLPFKNKKFNWANAKLVEKSRKSVAKHLFKTNFRFLSPEIFFISRRLSGLVMMLEEIEATTDSKEILDKYLALFFSKNLNLDRAG